MPLTLEQRCALEDIIRSVDPDAVKKLRWNLLIAYAEDQYDSYLVQLARIANAQTS